MNAARNEFLHGFMGSILQFFSNAWNWIKTTARISPIILFITLVVLILTFQYAYRPFVGVIRVNSHYDNIKKDLTAHIIIKNTSNIPANITETTVKMFHNGADLGSIVGTSRIVLFPEQETSLYKSFHNVQEISRKNDNLDILLEINYDLPIRLFTLRVYTRKFKTVTRLRYNDESGLFSGISGQSS